MLAVHQNYSIMPTVSRDAQHASQLASPCQAVTVSASIREYKSQLASALSANKDRGCARTVDANLCRMKCS